MQMMDHITIYHIPYQVYVSVNTVKKKNENAHMGSAVAVEILGILPL